MSVHPPSTASIARATCRCRCSSTWPYVFEVSVIELCPTPLYPGMGPRACVRVWWSRAIAGVT